MSSYIQNIISFSQRIQMTSATVDRFPTSNSTQLYLLAHFALYLCLDCLSVLLWSYGYESNVFDFGIAAIECKVPNVLDDVLLLLDWKLPHYLLEQFRSFVSQHFVVEPVQFVHCLVVRQVSNGPVSDNKVELSHAKVTCTPGQLVSQGVDSSLKRGKSGD